MVNIGEQIGNDVYASYDGFCIRIDQNASRVVLDPVVLARLRMFQDRIIEAEKDAQLMTELKLEQQRSKTHVSSTTPDRSE